MGKLPDAAEACGCILPVGTRPRATCWYCIHGQHDSCTANQHGHQDSRCPRIAIARQELLTRAYELGLFCAAEDHTDAEIREAIASYDPT